MKILILLSLSLGGLGALAERNASGDIYSNKKVASSVTPCQEFRFLIDQPDAGLVSKHLNEALHACAQSESECVAEVRILKVKHPEIARSLSAQCGQRVAMLRCYPAQPGQPGNGSQGGAGGRGGYCEDDGQGLSGGDAAPAPSDDDDYYPPSAYPSARSGANGRNGASINGGVGGQGGAAGQGPYGGAGGNGGAGTNGGVGGRGGAGGRSY